MKTIALLLLALTLVGCQATKDTSPSQGSSIGDSNLAAGQAYMAQNAKRAGVTTTASGIQYKILRAGGKAKYDPTIHGTAPTATVMYRGRLIDGTVFDQSDSPIQFNIMQVIPGFTEALQTMPIGSVWEVTIPAHLAYGEHGPASIGPNSTLIFEMALLDLSR
ncbi:MAG: FKBP-type peptidyl-prolyl cis-trans isomerase [Akkermansia sp.]